MSIIHPQKIQIKDFQEITVAIDSLDDIFSDFDPRPLAQRALSEDFLKEIKKFYKETASGRVIITFLGPVELKPILEKNQTEKAIINHLHVYFRRQAQNNKRAIEQIFRRGFIYVIFGMTLLLTLTLLGYFKIIGTFALELAGILLMPLGWFGIWEGFSKLVDVPYRLKEDAVMYDKLAKAQYNFKFLGENLK